MSTAFQIAKKRMNHSYNKVISRFCIFSLPLLILSMLLPHVDAFLEGLYCGQENCYDGKLFLF